MRRGGRWVPAGVLGVGLVGHGAFVVRGGLAGVAAWYSLMSFVAGAAALTLVVVLVHAVRKRRVSAPMVAAAGLAALGIWPGLWNFGLLTIPYPARLERTAPAATVRLPTDARMRVGWGGDTARTNYHVYVPDQRWAYDLGVEPAFTGAKELSAFGCWGTPVVAPAAGTIRLAEDGHEDRPPGDPANDPKHPTGNAIAIELASGTFLVLAHLQKGSVRVHVGDHVEEGDLIAACGNSGHTTEPHVHIHHQRQDPATHPPGFAEGLPLYFRDHDGAPMPEGGFTSDGDHPKPSGALVRHVGAAQQASTPARGELTPPPPASNGTTSPPATVEEALKRRFGEAVPKSVVVQTIERPGGRGHALLGVDTARPGEAVVIASDPSGAVTWTRDRPAAGITPPIGPMALAAGDAGRVALAVCDPPTKRVALRLWDEDGSPFADFDVMDEEDCSALALLHWPHHGFVVVSARPGSTRAQLVAANGSLAWRRGIDIGARTKTGNPVALVADTADTFVLVQYAASSGEIDAPEHALAFRYDAAGVPRWTSPVDLGPRPSRASADANAITATRPRSGAVRVRLGREPDIELGSDGVVTRGRR